jgi:hypothetical protein
MGGEKFHITVTIDNEKALQIAGLPDFLQQEFRRRGINPRSRILGQKNNTRAYPGTTLRLEIFLSRSAIKAADVVGFFPADICVGAVTRCRLHSDSDEGWNCGCGYI